jgi:hypothetical protein
MSINNLYFMIGVYNKYLLKVIGRHLRYFMIGVYNKYLLKVIDRHLRYFMIEVYNKYLLKVIDRGLCEQFLEVKNHIFTSLKDSTFIIFVFFSSDYQCVLKYLTSSHKCRLITPSRYVLYTPII